MSDSFRDADSRQLNVLLVPDSTYWILGTIAKNIARFNPWMDATVVSGPVLKALAEDDPAIFDRFDLVHFLCPYASKDWLPRLRDHLPVVTSHHHVTDWSFISHNVDGDAIVTGSSEWVEDMVNRGVQRDRIVCVPYGVDANLFSPASPHEKTILRSQLGLPANGPVVGFFAKMGSNDDDRKGIDVFCAAINRLHALEPSAGVLIVGPGWQKMVTEFRRQGIACAWFPFLENLADVARLYNALDFYWVTARVEGGPVPLLEAMSTEVCCLSTAVGLARDIVDGSNALLLPFDDSERFAAETIRMWNDPASCRSMGKKARETIVAQMHIAVTLPGISRAYHSAFNTFAARTGKIRAFMPRVADGAHVPREDVVPLSALSHRERKRASMLEALEWSESLVHNRGQHLPAFRLIAKAWRIDPMSARPLRVLLRRFLPEGLVRRIVLAKHSVRVSRTL